MRHAGLALIAAALSGPAWAGSSADPICTDRPGKGSATCAAPKGRLQVETSLAHWSETISAGKSERVLTLGDTAIKYGLTGRLHLEVSAPLLTIKRVREAGATKRASGFGDIKLKLKQEIATSGPLSAAIYPYVKLPTASKRLGNGKVEGGLVVPLGLALGGPWSLSAAPQVDAIRDGDGHGYHAAMTQQVALNLQASKALSVSAELWGQWDWDPAGTVRKASADAAAAYKLTGDLQFDAGANLGLNRATADVEVYGGLSVRF